MRALSTQRHWRAPPSVQQTRSAIRSNSDSAGTADLRLLAALPRGPDCAPPTVNANATALAAAVMQPFPCHDGSPVRSSVSKRSLGSGNCSCQPEHPLGWIRPRREISVSVEGAPERAKLRSPLQERRSRTTPNPKATNYWMLAGKPVPPIDFAKNSRSTIEREELAR